MRISSSAMAKFGGRGPQDPGDAPRVGHGLTPPFSCNSNPNCGMMLPNSCLTRSHAYEEKRRRRRRNHRGCRLPRSALVAIQQAESVRPRRSFRKCRRPAGASGRQRQRAHRTAPSAGRRPSKGGASGGPAGQHNAHIARAAGKGQVLCLACGWFARNSTMTEFASD